MTKFEEYFDKVMVRIGKHKVAICAVMLAISITILGFDCKVQSDINAEIQELENPTIVKLEHIGNDWYLATGKNFTHRWPIDYYEGIEEVLTRELGCTVVISR